jgi:hypothetical protein
VKPHFDGRMDRAFRILSIVFSKPNCGSTDVEILFVFIGKVGRVDDVSEARSGREARGKGKMLGSSANNQSADTLPNHRECPAATNLC